MGSLDEYTAALKVLPPPARRKAIDEAAETTAKYRWVPNPGPQTDAYLSEADELLYGGEAGGGKPLAIDTPLPTPFGWTTMGEVQVGEQLISETGEPCSVVAKSEVFNKLAYCITFSDGSAIVAGPGHQWVTRNLRERMRSWACSEEKKAERRATRPSRGTGKRPDLAKRNSETRKSLNLPRCGVRTTEELHSTLRVRGRINHSIDVAGAMRLPTQDLPLDPYILGLWLGDGNTACAAITSADSEIMDAMTANGYELRYRSKYHYGVAGSLQKTLRTIGVLGNKHIPVAYLRASYEQRLALLQGLMDTDGTAARDGECQYTSTKKALADTTAELVQSLGIKISFREGIARLNGRAIGPKYTVAFLTEKPAFRLPRKLLLQKRAGFRGTHAVRYIIGIECIGFVKTQCVQIDSPSRMYLCGRSMIPTHNSDLVVGLSLTEHQRSLVLRRTNGEAVKLFDRYTEIIGHDNGKNEQKGWRIDGKIIDIGGCQLEQDKQKRKGIPHDLKAFDELVDFTKSQYEFIITWNRSTDPLQRCRIVATTNPPTRPEGMWVVERWAAWLDPKHPNPAKSGELRWYTNINGKDTEVDGPGPHDDGRGRQVMARSRTFIRARLDDNPDLTQTEDYAARLDALPEELREAYREGKFDVGLRDAPNQAIPTAWIRAAMDRWTEKAPAGVPMCGMGVDCSGGGVDPMMIAIRYDGWYDKLIEIPGKDIPAERPGKHAAGMVLSYRRDNAIVVVDMGGGYGGPTFEQLHDNAIPCQGHKGSEKSTRRTADGQLRFYNKRSEVIWKFREALDPAQPHGSHIALPPDPVLLADLAAPGFWTTKIEGQMALQIEDKLAVCARLNRSTDRGDAVVMGYSAGPTYITDGDMWRAAGESGIPGRYGRALPQVVMSKRNRRSH